MASPGLLDGSGVSGHDAPDPLRRDNSRPAAPSAGRGAYLPAFDSQTVCIMAPRLRELIALSLLAGLGFGLALGRGDVIFVGVFGAACAMAIIGGTQRFP